MHRARTAHRRDWSCSVAAMRRVMLRLVVCAARCLSKQELLYVGGEFLGYMSGRVAQRAGERQHQRVMRAVQATRLPAVYRETRRERGNGARPRDSVTSIVGAHEERVVQRVFRTCCEAVMRRSLETRIFVKQRAHSELDGVANYAGTIGRCVSSPVTTDTSTPFPRRPAPLSDASGVRCAEYRSNRKRPGRVEARFLRERHWRRYCAVASC